MKPARTLLVVLLLGSLAINLHLLLKTQAETKPSSRINKSVENSVSPETAWRALYDPDLKVFTQNLRSAGVPEHWIRAVISALIDAQFHSREEALFPTRQLKFWQRDDRTPSLQTSLALLDLRREKAKLKLTLLGSDDSSADPLSPYNLVPASSRELVQTIKEDYDVMIRTLRKKAGYNPTSADRDQILYVENEKIKELRAYLSDKEIAALEMQASPFANELRQELRYFPVSEDEFTAIYRARIAMREFSQRTEGGAEFVFTGEDSKQVQTAHSSDAKSLKAELAKALGPDRYAAYLRGKDFEYQNLQNLVSRANLPASVGDQVFNLRDTASAESNRIFNDANLDVAQKHAAFKTLAQNIRTRYVALLGSEAGQAYGKTRWLSSLEKGGRLSFQENGHSMQFLDPNDDL